MKTVLALIITLLLITFGFNAYAIVPKAETEAQQEVLVVRDTKGDYVGTVTTALVDESGNIAFIIISTGEMGQQNKEIAVPLGLFFLDRENKSLYLNISKEGLSLAPEFTTTDLSDPTFAERVYRFFGLTPSWTEGTTEE